jgi:hypothetical protein
MFNFFKRKRYNVSTLPDISRINLNLFFREFESILLLKLSDLDIKNADSPKELRVAAIINQAKDLALAAVKESVEIAYRPK